MGSATGPHLSLPFGYSLGPKGVSDWVKLDGNQLKEVDPNKERSLADSFIPGHLLEIGLASYKTADSEGEYPASIVIRYETQEAQ